MHPMLNIAIRAARTAGDSIVREMDRTRDISIETKGKNDFVTEVDKNAEGIIISVIKNAYPEHAFLAEESGQEGQNDCLWIIDPLDGTTNFLHGFPHFSVSIALQNKGVLEQAVIYDPLKQELFTASKGKGAYLNMGISEGGKYSRIISNERLRVTSTNGLKDTLIGTGFPFRHPEHLDCYLKTFKAIHRQVSDIRRAGSAALDLAYLAAGRLDGFWEIGLNIWDIAAGALLVKEAGGFIGDFSGRDKYLETGNVVAGNADVYKILLKTIHPHLSDELQR